jgi:hypothetical protein
MIKEVSLCLLPTCMPGLELMILITLACEVSIAYFKVEVLTVFLSTTAKNLVRSCHNALALCM